MPLDGKAVRAGVLESLERINLGPKRSKFGVTMWPLLGPDLPNQKYELIDNAIVDGRCEIYEADQASVDHVVVANRSAEPIFALHGQLLRGAKQNRSINLTAMLPPESETTILVACVEQGRWNTGYLFEDAKFMQSAAGRSEKLGSVLSDLERSGKGRANQSQVWAQQAVKERRLKYESHTHDEIEIQERALGVSELEIFDLLPAIDDQVGAIFCANNCWSVEIFDKQSTYLSYHKSLLRSLAVEASEANMRGINSHDPDPRSLLDAMWKTTWRAKGVSGEGELIGGRHSGSKHCALLWQDGCVSVSSSGFLSQI